jgi:PAS domain S-box-containing protein
MHAEADLPSIQEIETANSERINALLWEKEKQFFDLYDNSPVAYFTVSAADGSIINCNQAAERLIGRSKKKLIRMKVFDLYADTKHGLPKAKRVFKRFKAGEAIEDAELQIKNSAGKLVWVSLWIRPVLDKNGKVIRSRSILVDISGRKQAEEALSRILEGVKEQVKKRTAELGAVNQKLKQEIEERKQIEADLKKARKELEQRVQARTSQLKTSANELKSKQKELLQHKSELEQLNKELLETNKAISVLAKNIDKSRQDSESRIARAINSNIIPIIEDLRGSKTLDNLQYHLDTLATHMRTLANGLTGDQDLIRILTQTEVRVATLIKNGLTSQSIAKKLYVSLHTVKTHRRNIRKKLNVRNSAVNLVSLLRSIM